MYNPFVFEEPKKKNVFELQPREKGLEQKREEPFVLSRSITTNREYIQKRFDVPNNNDVILRDFLIKGEKKAFALFYDGMVDSNFVNSNIIETLQLIPIVDENNIALTKEELMYRFISHCQAQVKYDIEEAIEEVNFGGCAVFVDGADCVFVMDVRSWGHRGIQKPENEQAIFGPQEAFNEMLRNNSALVRKILKTEKLICQGVKIGTVSKTRGVVMYIDNVANQSLVKEVISRINSIDVDYIFAVEEVANFVRDNKFSITNQILSTERPDRCARYLADGRVALLLSGSPNSLIFPTNAYELTHSPSDSYMNNIFVNFARGLRILAMLLSVLLPGAYLAMTLFHQEMIPTYLLYSISASRENVPFPSFLELLIMDLSFELIREAGLRMPGALGSTLGIVGGLILGQAAVSAKIVSPIMIIIIAITGIGSFATSNYSLGWSYRLLRLAFVVLGASFGFYGIGAGVFLYSVYLATLTNFGTSFLSPLPDSGIKNIIKAVFHKNIWSDELRPDYLKTKKPMKEAKISRKWLFKGEGDR